MSDDTTKTGDNTPNTTGTAEPEGHEVVTGGADVVTLPEFSDLSSSETPTSQHTDFTEDSNPLVGFDFSEIQSNDSSYPDTIGEDYLIGEGDSFVYAGHGDDRLHMDDFATNPEPQAETAVETPVEDTSYVSDTVIFEGIDEIPVTQSDSGLDNLVGGSGEDSFTYNADQGEVSENPLENENLDIFDSSIDLGSLNPISSETLNLDQALDSFLSLSSDDVLNMSDDNHVTITGDAKDVVNLEGEWTIGETIDGYTNYTSGDASLSIENTIVDAGGVNIV